VGVPIAVGLLFIYTQRVRLAAEPVHHVPR
jgi:hypothetical protein